MPSLAENRSAVKLTQLHPELNGIKVVRALEALASATEGRDIDATSRKDVEEAFQST